MAARLSSSSRRGCASCRALPEKLAAAAQAELEQLGVRLLANTRATEVSADPIIAAGERIECHLMVWVAGVEGPEIPERIGELETNRSRQLVLRPTLQTSRDSTIDPVRSRLSFP